MHVKSSPTTLNTLAPHRRPAPARPGPTGVLMRAAGLGVLAAAMGATPSTASAQWDLLTVSDTNTLMRVDLSSGPSYTATAIGVTQDASGGLVRRIRGLAYAGTTLYGMTREGDLVEVNPNTGETTFRHSVGGGANEFWSDLAYDTANDALYTVHAFGHQSLVRIDLGTMTHTIQGPTEWTVDGSRRQMLGVEFMGGMLLGSNRQNENIVEMNPADGSFDFTWGSWTSGVTNPQQIAVHPGTGVLWGIHDHFSTSNNAALSTFDAAFLSTEMGELPFGIVESVGGGNDTYGWGGIAFIPVPSPGTSTLLMLAGVNCLRRRRG